MELNNKTLIENSSIKLFFKFAIPSILGMIMGSAAVFVDGFLWRILFLLMHLLQLI